MLSPSTIKFLKELKKNNNKAWFDINRKMYEEAKADFAAFIQKVIDQLSKKDLSIKKVRQEIDYNFAAFRKITSSNIFKSVYSDLSRDQEYVLTRLPKGYEADNPAAAYLKLKSFVAMTSQTQ